MNSFVLKMDGLLFMLFFTALIAHAQTFDWKKASEKEGIVVYTSSVKGSSLKAYRAETEVRSTLSALVALITDVENFSNWMPRTANPKLIKGTRENYIYYIETPAPWPVQNRDAVSEVTVKQDSKTLKVRIDFQSTTGHVPPREGFLRIPHSKGLWELTPRPNGLVRIVYQAHADPGGQIPAWLSNQVVTETPFEALKNLRIEVAKSTYAQARLPFIREPAN
jgi:hypothetical protein